MADLPNVCFINLVDSPAVVTYGNYGDGFVPLDSVTGSIYDISGYRKVCVQIGATQATTCVLAMGKISNSTMAQAFPVPLDQKIHTFEVIGPQMNLCLKGGPPKTKEKVPVWVFLQS